MAIWGVFGAFALATGAALSASAILAPATAGAAVRKIAPAKTIRGRQVRSGEGTPGFGPLAVPLRVANQEAYAREKQRAAKLAAGRAGTSESGAAESPSASETTEAATAVFGSLNANGLNAAQQIATFGIEGDVTPPDTTGAIGPEDYVEFVNSEIAAYSRSGLAMIGSPVGISEFTGGVGPCDPQIKYDPQSSRWFYAAIGCEGGENTVYVGWSKTSDPTDLSTASGGGWCGYAYGTGSILEDYPKLGLDASHIIVGANAFNIKSGAFLTANILSLPKPAAGAIETCPAAPTLTTFGSKAEPLTTSVEGHVATSPEPATVADESPSGYVVAADMTTPFGGNGSHLMIWQVAGTGAAPQLLALGAPAVSSFKLPPNVPQPSTSDELDTLDGRLTQAVAAADPNAGGAEAVWTQHTVAGGAGTVVRWYELLPGKLEVRQAGTISSSSLYAFNGAIAPTLSGGAAIDYDTGSGSAEVQIAAQTRAASDPLGTMSAPVVLQSSAAIDSDFSCPSVAKGTSISCRWGDYAGASTDPIDSNVVWGSNQVNGPAAKHNAQWATQNFALTPAAPQSPPTAVTGAASKVTSSSAKLNALVNPNGGEVTECEFEYGTSSSYGSSVPCSALPGSGTSLVAVSASLAGLAANTVYHFRISATNAGGTSKGSDEEFSTLANPPTVTGIEPAEGPQTGGTKVTITGTHFTGATAVDFGASAAKSFQVESETSITAESPAGTGTVDVTVTTAEGKSATGSSDRFTYVPSEGCDYFTNTAGGSWFTAGNWSKGAPPATGEEACITAAGTYTVAITQLGSNVSLKSLTIGGESGKQTLLIGSSCLMGAALSATEGIAVEARGAIVLTDGELCAGSVTLGGAVANAGTITAEQGSGGARIVQGELINTATVAIDTSTAVEGSLVNEKLLSIAAGATLQVGGGCVQGKRGKLEAAIESASSFGALSAGGSAKLAGKLALQPAKGFTPSLGQIFPIVTASSRTGTFAKETKGVIKKSLPGLYYDPVYSTTGLTLVVTQAILADAPSEGVPGSAVTLSGSGFPAEDKIKLWFKDGGVKTVFGKVLTDANGEFSTEVTVPAGAALGSGTFFAKSISTGVKATAAFSVT